MRQLRPYLSVLDDQSSLGKPAAPLLLGHCHRRAGERFADWLRRTPNPLQSNVATVRDAAAFAADLEREIHELDPEAHLRVCSLFAAVT